MLFRSAKSALAAHAEDNEHFDEAIAVCNANVALAERVGNQSFRQRGALLAGCIEISIGRLDRADAAIKVAMQPDGPRLIETHVLDQQTVSIFAALDEFPRGIAAAERGAGAAEL